MTRAIAALLAAMFIAVGVSSFSGQATAQYVKPRPVAKKCGDMIEQYGPKKVWWGQFHGARDFPSLFDDYDRVQWTSQEACFVKLKNCKLWLYWMQSDWDLHQRIVRCDKGYRGYRLKAYLRRRG